MTLPIDKAALCPQFVGRTIRGVKNAESPAWLKDRLTAIGLRPVSALVDITQYLTIDLGRPLHAFDDAKLNGAVGPRLAKDGETLVALNGKTYTLDATVVAIADESAALGIGGVMGGEPSCRIGNNNHGVSGIGPVRSPQHRRHRPQTADQFRCALLLRARRRS